MLFRMTSLSLDYVLTLVLAVILAVKYIVFDCDDDTESQDAPVTMETEPATAATSDKFDRDVTVMNSVCVSEGQSEQTDDVANDTLSSETTDDIATTEAALTRMSCYCTCCVHLMLFEWLLCVQCTCMLAHTHILIHRQF